MSLYPDYLLVSSKRYRMETARYRFAWDDENPDWNNKCRTLHPDFPADGPDNPPAVLRFYRDRHEGDDYRVNMEKDPTWRWRETIIALNGSEQDFYYWINANTAQFNTTGWPQFAYVGMSGNEIKILERAGDWVRFETLRPTDWLRARSMTIETHPTLIHRFTCVTWDAANRVTKHIESTGTPRGQVYYPLVTNEGSAWVPSRHIIERR
jgi:hypothetical protein